MLMNLVNRYIILRRSLGHKFEEEGWQLRSFARFAAERGETHVIAKTVIAWAEQSPSQYRRHRKLQTVIQFARFIRVEDEKHEIPPNGVFSKAIVRRKPYIFSNEEIELLVQEARNLGPSGSLRPHTYSTLWGLLFVTGMRISEALELRINDFTRDGLVVRNTKFQKTRLLPLHGTTEKALRRYLLLRRQIQGSDDHFFISNCGGNISYMAAYETFHKVCAAAEIPRQATTQKIRLHDLRHSFAVRTVETGPTNREHVNNHMLALMTYLGHACLTSTYWYLEGTPRLMKDIANACDAYMKGESK